MDPKEQCRMDKLFTATRTGFEKHCRRAMEACRLTGGSGIEKVKTELLESFHPLLGFVGAHLKDATRDSPEFQKEAETLQNMIKDIDGNADGKLNFKEVKNLTDIGKDALRFYYDVCDANGDGVIDMQEALALTWSLHNQRRCHGCFKPILALSQQGHCCAACWEAPTSPSATRSTRNHGYNLCDACNASPNPPGCPKHGTSRMVPFHQAGPAPAVLLVPGVEDNKISCMVCQEQHSLVLSYLRPGLMDLHMRPVMSRNPTTGQVEPQGFVCEFCSVRCCRKHSEDNVQWVLADIAEPGLANNNNKFCPNASSKKCTGRGTFSAWYKVKADAAARKAAHCPTCADKLATNQELYVPLAPPPEACPAEALRNTYSIAESVRMFKWQETITRQRRAAAGPSQLLIDLAAGRALLHMGGSSVASGRSLASTSQKSDWTESTMARSHAPGPAAAWPPPAWQKQAQDPQQQLHGARFSPPATPPALGWSPSGGPQQQQYPGPISPGETLGAAFGSTYQPRSPCSSPTNGSSHHSLGLPPAEPRGIDPQPGSSRAASAAAAVAVGPTGGSGASSSPRGSGSSLPSRAGLTTEEILHTSLRGARRLMVYDTLQEHDQAAEAGNQATAADSDAVAEVASAADEAAAAAAGRAGADGPPRTISPSEGEMYLGIRYATLGPKQPTTTKPRLAL